MAIEYTTEGRATLDDLIGTVGITWVKDGDRVTLHQGRDGKVFLSKKQLRELRNMIDDLCNDLKG